STRWPSSFSSLASLRRNEHPPHVVRHPTRQLPADQRRRNHPGGFEVLHEAAHAEGVALRLLALGQELLDLDLADHVARAIGRLLQVEELLVADERALQAQPPARRVLRRESRGLLEGPRVG